MSEGRHAASTEAEAHYLERPKGGRGLLLGGVAGVAPGKVVVIGGIVGYNAAVIALGLGAQVTILERSVDRMRHLEETLHGRVSLVMSSTSQIEESVREADVVIGAVLIPGALAHWLLTREMVRGMKQGSVFCDVAIDQGGCAETSHATTHDDPVYEVDGVIHYCVANMPGAVPITSTKALTNVTLPYVEASHRARARPGGRTGPQGARTRCERPRRPDHVRGRRRGAQPRLRTARRRSRLSRLARPAMPSRARPARAAAVALVEAALERGGAAADVSAADLAAACESRGGMVAEAAVAEVLRRSHCSSKRNGWTSTWQRSVPGGRSAPADPAAVSS